MANQAEHRVEGDLLLGRASRERVGARKIDHLDVAVPRQLQACRAALHRHAGIVADVRAFAGEAIVDAGFADVGIADDDHHVRRDHARRGGVR
jgi:hypothetical protein